MDVFAERLKGRRVRIGLTQRDFAQKAKIAPGTLSAYERGHKTPTVEVALRIADGLGVSLEWLCGRRDADAKTTASTYGELIHSLDRIVRSGLPVRLAVDEEEATLTLRDETLSQLFARWAPIIELLHGGTIDAEMYEPWLEKQIAEIAEQPIGRATK